MPLQVSQQAGHDRLVQLLRTVLGDSAFLTAWTEGQRMPLQEALVLALQGNNGSQ